MKRSSSDIGSWFRSLFAKKLTDGIDRFPNFDRTIAFPVEGSVGNDKSVMGTPRTKWTDSLVREITLPSITMSPDL